MKQPESKGKLCVVLGTLVGGITAISALAAWRAGAHGVEHSFALGLIAAGFAIAGLDATWRLCAPEVRASARWDDVAFDAALGARIEGWPAWLVGALLSAIATMLIASP